MAEAKFSAAQLRWAERDNHAGLLLASAQPEDATGAIIPGLTLQLEVKRPVVVDRCLYELGLFLLEHGIRHRVYQLHVSPPNKRSHNGASGTFYGPHEHIGDLASLMTQPDIVCGRMDVAFALFCSRINLTFTGSLNSPV